MELVFEWAEIMIFYPKETIIALEGEAFYNRHAEAYKESEKNKKAYLKKVMEMNKGNIVVFILTTVQLTAWEASTKHLNLQEHLIFERGPIKNHNYLDEPRKLWLKIYKFPEEGVKEIQ
jgi:hypothetical protein